MWPSEFIPELEKSQYFLRALSVAQQLYDDSEIIRDFDMLIYKAPHSGTPTPWHQDMSYWLNLPDSRAVSSWLALDNTTVDNGCMWFVPGSHKKPVRKHRASGSGTHQGKGALECDASEEEGVPVPIKAGSCTFHAGGTLHYSRGNTSDTQRRGFIQNFRHKDMVKYEREHQFDHGKTDNTRVLRNDQTK